jgi:hydroxymethylbilane synthase
MFIIGSRGSKLALWQANYTKDRLEALGYPCRIEIIQTTGDRFQSGPLKEIGNKGLFTKEIEESLLDGRIDIAVHSLKDMPTALPMGLEIVATPERQDPRDAIVGSRLTDLVRGAKVGTGSLRRVAQLAHLRPDLKIEPIRGNVDTRLRKLDAGEFDAIILATAGLNRLGWEERIAENLAVELMCPAVGQGALAIETRAEEGSVRDACLQLNHAPTYTAVRAERRVLAELGGGCQVPVGVYARIEGEQLHLHGVVVSVDGKTLVRQDAQGPVGAAEELGELLGQSLLEQGAQEILESVYG